MRSRSVGLLFICLVVPGCGGDDTPIGRAPGSRPAAGNALVDTGPAAGVPASGDTASSPVVPKSAPESGNQADAALSDGWTFDPTAGPPTAAGAATLAELRAARHDGFDRIVFEFADGLPGYRIAYASGPVRECGSGRAAMVAGGDALRIRFSPARAHTEAGEPTVADRERMPGLPVAKELELICDFEAVVGWVIGVGARRRYRAFTLEEPARLVVDVRHGGE